jgi:hypothetical protein
VSESSLSGLRRAGVARPGSGVRSTDSVDTSEVAPIEGDALVLERLSTEPGSPARTHLSRDDLVHSGLMCPAGALLLWKAFMKGWR